jgi:hypothetical protein
MSDIVERDIRPMSAEEVSKLKAAVEKRWDEKPHYPGGGGILSPGCMLRAEEVLGLIARIVQLERENAEMRSELESARSQARREALEEAAKVASPNYGPGIFDGYENGRRDAAAAIRRLAEQEAPEAAAIRKMEA